MTDKILKYRTALMAFKLNSFFEYHNIKQSQKKLFDQVTLLYQGCNSFGQGIFLTNFFLVFEESHLESLK